MAAPEVSAATVQAGSTRGPVDKALKRFQYWSDIGLFQVGPQCAFMSKLNMTRPLVYRCLTWANDLPSGDDDGHLYYSFNYKAVSTIDTNRPR